MWLVFYLPCAALPLPSASVDAVVCDLPFGRKFGTKANVAASLSVIVTEMERSVSVVLELENATCLWNLENSY